MGGDHVVRQKLRLAGRAGEFVESLPEIEKRRGTRFTHFIQDGIGGVFRRDLQLPGDMVRHEFPEIFVSQRHVIPDAGGDKHFLHTRQRAHPAQHINNRSVIHRQLGTDGGKDAALLRTGAVLEFVVALEAVHVGRRSAEIVDVALELRMLGELFCLAHNGRRAARADGAPFVDADRAEVAFAVTAPVRRDGKPDCLQRLDRPLLLVKRMLRPLEIEIRQRFVQRRRVLHQPPVAVLLAQAFRADRVVVLVKRVEHLDERCFVCRHRLIRRQLDVIGRFFFSDVAQTTHGARIIAGTECAGNFQRRFFRHAVQDEIRFRVK